MTAAFTAITTALALLGIAISVEHFMGADHYNPGFLAFPAIIGAHVVAGAIYLACGLAQFFRPLREGWPAVHRAVGRVAILSGVISGLTAIAITVLFPFHGPAAVYLVAPFALLFVFALIQAFSLARAGHYERHREWMMRAFAIGTGVATMRLIFVPAFLLLGEVSDERARPLSLFSFVAAFLIHLAIAEGWIRYSRGRVRPPVLAAGVTV
jgi:uncharacterized membrane protein